MEQPVEQPDDEPAEPEGSDPSAEVEVAAPPAGNPLLTCLEAGNYNQCIVEELEGHARTAREFEALVEAYRQSGNQSDAFSNMEEYRRRWPDTPTARSYGQILAAHGR